LELLRPGEVNTYKGPGSGRDRFFLSPAMDRAFESLMVLTCMPLSALYGVLYFLLRSLFGIRVFDGLKGCGVPVGRVFLSTMLLPLLLVVSIGDLVGNRVGLRPDFTSRFVAKWYPNLWK
jgi:hypothetical protein